MYYYLRQQDEQNVWGHGEAKSNVNRFRGQYIRIHVVDMGWIIAQLLGYDATNDVVELNIFPKGFPELLLINAQNVTGLIPLGFNTPPELSGGWGSGGWGSSGMGSGGWGSGGTSGPIYY